MRWLRDLAARARHRELLTLLAVGGFLSVVVFKLVRGQPGLTNAEPTAAGILAVVAAVVVSYVGIRFLPRRFGRRIVLAPPAAAGARARSSRRPRVLIVSASVAAGHDGAADELGRQASAEGYDVDRVDYLDLLPWGLGTILRSGYRLQLTLAPGTWGWLMPRLGSGTLVADLSARLARRRLREACADPLALTVSTYPLASQTLGRMRLSGELWCPVVTFLTDMSVHPLWVTPGVDAHLALHAEPARQARALGARNVEVVGPAVSPLFRPFGPAARAEARQQFGLPRDEVLALVVGGSWGVGDVARTVEDVLATGAAVPVVVCGTNRHLLAAMQDRPDVISLGWVSDMPSLMGACDAVVQNAGGLTSLEARQAGVPLVTYRSLPGHGMTNSRALELAGWTTWARNRAELATCMLLAATQRPLPAPPGEIPWLRLAPTGLRQPA